MKDGKFILCVHSIKIKNGPNKSLHLQRQQMTAAAGGLQEGESVLELTWDGCTILPSRGAFHGA